jgi:hypothetical protein
MKKLLLILLCLPLLFNSCEEDEQPTNTGNNNNSTLAIGDTYQGGIIFYLDGIGGGLIAAPSDQGQAEWGCYGAAISGADGITIGTGSLNTDDIEAGCTTPGTAADICANLTLGGYSDWFLPSFDELNEMYLTVGFPYGNTSANTNIGGFASDIYWSSTEDDVHQQGNNSINYSRVLDFTNGNVFNNQKNNIHYVRAIRAF